MIEMLMHPATRLYYETTAISEYLYHFLGYHGEKAPGTLKENERIPAILTVHDPKQLFGLFSQLNTMIPRVDEVLHFMKNYNLLSNDAIILSHCKSAGIQFIASYDSDFVVPCEREGIALISKIEAFQRIAST
ncbi:MAG: PIN domain-containing protein [Bacteroidetes bacterium]|nr:PIN domain-containing protein [Bacteroidota bacterium]